jgi:hypothetical protein
MSLSDAKRTLQWNIVMEALADAGVDSETVKLVESSRDASKVFHPMAGMLMGSADVAHAKNYVKVEMVGLIPPFERAYVELVRPGGKTSHELRELLRDRLTHVRKLLAEGDPTDARREGLIQGIDEDLATEAP